MSNNFYYCKRCGNIVWTLEIEGKTCACCQSKLYPVPNEYTDNFRWRDGDGEKALIEEKIKTAPEFDQYLFKQKDIIIAEKTAKFEAAMAHGRAIMEEKNRVPKCISCGSTNVSKIGAVSRGISAHLFGIASSKVGKTYKCNHCGTMW